MTIVKGKFLKPDSTAVAGVQVQAFLGETMGESAGIEVYTSSTSVSTTSDATGSWQLTLWANSNGVNDTKYTFLVTYPGASVPIRYEMAVPNAVEVFFSDLMASTTAAARAEEIFNTEAGQYDLKIIQGNSVRRKFELTDSANQPMDLTGWSAKLTIKDQSSAYTLIITPTITAATGLISVVLTPIQTTALADKNLIYELFIYKAADAVKIVFGSITVSSTFSVI